MHARVPDNGKSSVAFPITNGVKLGCILAPTHFSIIFSAMLFDAFAGSDNGIDIRYRTEGSVFNLRRLQAKTKVKPNIANEFLFVDVCTLNATTEANMQYGQVLSGRTICTKVMHQPAPRKPNVELNITVKRQRLKMVEKFTYLGNILSKSIVMDDEVNARLAKVSAAFG